MTQERSLNLAIVDKNEKTALAIMKVFEEIKKEATNVAQIYILSDFGETIRHFERQASNTLIIDIFSFGVPQGLALIQRVIENSPYSAICILGKEEDLIKLSDVPDTYKERLTHYSKLAVDKPPDTLKKDAKKVVRELASYQAAIGYQLYEKVKDLLQGGIIDETRARLIIEYADDAIKAFDSGNQTKKVELKKIKSDAEKSLPPATIEELKKRAEGQLLEKLFPRQKWSRRILLYLIALVIIAIPFGLMIKEVTKKYAPTEIGNADSNQDTKQADLHRQPSTPEPSGAQGEVKMPKESAKNFEQISWHTNNAHKLFSEGQYDAALKECNKALTLEPKNKVALSLKKRISKTMEILQYK